jgi:hypothetical protein
VDIGKVDISKTRFERAGTLAHTSETMTETKARPIRHATAGSVEWKMGESTGLGGMSLGALPSNT